MKNNNRYIFTVEFFLLRNIKNILKNYWNLEIILIKKNKNKKFCSNSILAKSNMRTPK